MLGTQTDFVQIVVRSGVVYLATYFMFRLVGKGEIAQLNPADFILILLISNAVQNAMVGGDASILGGLVAAITLLVLSVVMKAVERRDIRLDHLLEGTAVELVRDGVVIDVALARARMSRDELDRALRRGGAIGADEVRLAMLETDGTISVVTGR